MVVNSMQIGNANGTLFFHDTYCRYCCINVQLTLKTAETQRIKYAVKTGPMVRYENVNWYLLYAKPTERQTDVTLMTGSFLAQERWISAENRK